mmetsp:Transcript_133729/g.333725  ORF Transcript_133729/g.333725 Transcript_133729/m.333725 type:complete len:244 (-) Transcript_133729:700-1431(-)
MQTTVSATGKKSPLPPITITVLTPLSSKRGFTRLMKGVIGSLSGATSSTIGASRIMKFVAHVSSSISIAVAPNSNASTIFAAWDVEPDASDVVKAVVSRLKGRLLMKGEMFAQPTKRPSSDRIFTALRSVTTNSRPSPSTLLYTPTCKACNKVLLPWNPPPTIIVIPRLMPMPEIVPLFGTVISHDNEGGLSKTTRLGSSFVVIGRSSTPLFLGSTLPSATKATKPRSASCARQASWSSTDNM